MFKKLVSNLPFSPGLVGQIGFYAKRLRKEEVTRRLGLIFTALALVVQSFAVFSPPSSANAASGNDLIYGGCTTKQCILDAYDNNTQGYREFMDYFGITRAELNAGDFSRDRYIVSTDWPISFGRWQKNNESGSVEIGGQTYFYGNLTAWDGSEPSWYWGLRGNSAKAGAFSIIGDCANLNLKQLPPPPPPPMCTVPGKTHLPAGDPNCKVDMCTVPGKTHLPAGDPGCKVDKCTVPGKTHLPAGDPGCKLDPVASCSLLNITKFGDTYQLNATAAVANGATVKAFVYTIKRDGKVVDTITKTVANGELTNIATTKQTKQGSYEVILTVKTTVGDFTKAECVKTFKIPPPERCPQNKDLLKDDPECQPCPGDNTIWIKDDKCKAEVIFKKTAKNVTQGGLDATKTTARASERIIYTLTIENIGKNDATLTPKDGVGDILEYAKLLNYGDAKFDDATKTLTWGEITLKPGEKQTREFTIQMLDKIPSTATGSSNPRSYDCKMMNNFGNDVSIGVDCPIPKTIVETPITKLPATGPRENMIFAGVLASVVVFFYARSKQLGREIRLVRKEFSASAI